MLFRSPPKGVSEKGRHCFHPTSLFGFFQPVPDFPSLLPFHSTFYVAHVVRASDRPSRREPLERLPRCARVRVLQLAVQRIQSTHVCAMGCAGIVSHPDEGIEWQLTLSCALTSSAVCAVVYTALLALDHRRKGRKWWLWKTVKRPSGSYIAIK